jgi:hypothetical protein
MTREIELGTSRLPQICGELTFHNYMDSKCMIRGVTRGLTDVKDNPSVYPEPFSTGRTVPESPDSSAAS